MWFYAGLIFLGLSGGFLVALSITPVVGTLLGVLFVFAGGSILALIKGKDAEERNTIGKSIISITVGIVLGISVGIYVRNFDLLGSSEKNINAPSFKYDGALKVEDIILMTQKGVSPLVIREILTNNPRSEKIISIGNEEIIKMSEKNVDSSVIISMFRKDALSSNKKNKADSSGWFLYSDEVGSDCGDDC